MSLQSIKISTHQNIKIQSMTNRYDITIKKNVNVGKMKFMLTAKLGNKRWKIKWSLVPKQFVIGGVKKIVSAKRIFLLNAFCEN